MYADKRLLLGLVALAFAVAGVCWKGLLNTQSASPPRSIRKDLAQGWSLLWNNPPVLSLTRLNFTINLAFA